MRQLKADPFRWARPLLRLLPPEAAHRLTLRALAAGLSARADQVDDAILGIRLWGLDFPNPVGLSAGFDKDAEVYGAMLRLGFGFVEVGSVTPRPQAGNPRPRVFRLPEEGAVINRLGFNSAGHAVAAANLRRRAPARRGIVGVNLGKNRDSADAVADYAAGAAALGPYADYLVINVSSPNTPGLRRLQEPAALRRLIAAIAADRRRALPERPLPLLLKIAPDLDAAGREDIAEVALTAGIDGLVISNTTIARPAGLKGRHAAETGGLSGRPLFVPSTELVRDMYRLTKGRLPLIGVGGIAGGADAYAKIRAGASLVQLYTALIYEGPSLVGRMKRELASRLRADGFRSLAEAVGADHR